MIHKLSQSVINKIAAGEVIERPASVVKELMENSIDAGATRIDVYVDKGGSDLIRVVDNGSGIPADELPLAVAPHATSKIQEADDLFKIQTMGFRGEALASIAEISRFRIKSRTADSDEGASLEVVAGKVGEVVPCGCPVGTTMEVLNIFCNTPVRKKYLKSVSTEFGYVSEQFYRIALPNPNVSFTLTHNGKSVSNLPGTGAFQQRITDVFGRELSENLIWVESKAGDISINGYVAHPSQTRSNNKTQYLFLNGRFIRDKSLQHALQEAYRGLITVGRYPIAFLFLNMPYENVDVNVHPTKLEVRFQDSSRLYSALLSSIRQKFLTTDMRSHVSFPSPDGPSIPNPNYNNEFNNPTEAPIDDDLPNVPNLAKHEAFNKNQKGSFQSSDSHGQSPTGTYPEFNQFDGKHNKNASQADDIPFATIPQSDLKAQSDFLEGACLAGEKDKVMPSNKPDSKMPMSNQEPTLSGAEEPKFESRSTLPLARFGQPPEQPAKPSNTISVDDFRSGIGNKKVPEFKPFEDATVNTPPKPAPPKQVEESGDSLPLPNNRSNSTSIPPAIQIHNKYIVTQLPEGLAIIDQHALHERILYERIKKSVESHDVVLQQMLVPAAIDLTPNEFAVVLERRNDLAQLGLLIEPFGGQTILLTAYPAILKKQSPEELLHDVIELLVNEVKKLERVEVLEEIYHRMACRAAVKAGSPLSKEEINELLTEMNQCDNVHHCPHGRPSILVYTQEELDKQFKRT